jgi:hypothetical protein
MKEAPGSSETSVLTRATQHNIPENTILHSHCSENLKSYMVLFYFIIISVRCFYTTLYIRRTEHFNASHTQPFQILTTIVIPKPHHVHDILSQNDPGYTPSLPIPLRPILILTSNLRVSDRLCGQVVTEAADTEVSGSVPGTTGTSDR